MKKILGSPIVKQLWASSMAIRRNDSTCNNVMDKVDELTKKAPHHKQELKPLTPEDKKIIVRERIAQIEKEKGTPPFFDMYMRPHNYLRISLTEKCQYCMPVDGIPLKPKRNMLTNEEIFRLVHLFTQNGVDKVRLTGGEPTVRKDIVQIVEGIASTPRITDVGLTTNGFVLTRYLNDLVEAGMSKLNISIDSLNKQKFARITRVDALPRVLKAIDESLKVFSIIKLNVVAIKGTNDDEIIDFIRLTKHKNIDVRFIEFMPFGGDVFTDKKFLGYKSMLAQIVEEWGDDVIRLQDDEHDTTKNYKIKGYDGKFGFITSMTDHFCNTCNRLRITADGNIKVCLHGNAETSLRDMIRSGCSDAEITEVIQMAVNKKKARHAARFFSQFSNFYSFRRVCSHLSNNLTHVDSSGKAKQVDVSSKSITTRVAIASGSIIVTPEIMKQITRNQNIKGDVLTVAKIASILGAKSTSQIIPLCHPIPLDYVDTQFELFHDTNKVTAISTAKCSSNTGVEMEALTACTVALLTVYDMCKAVSPKMILTDIKLIRKTGGKSDYTG